MHTYISNEMKCCAEQVWVLFARPLTLRARPRRLGGLRLCNAPGLGGRHAPDAVAPPYRIYMWYLYVEFCAWIIICVHITYM